jgi:hypothetical protein
MIDFGLVITFPLVVRKTRWVFRQLDGVHASHTGKKKSVCSSLNPLTSGRTPQNGVLFI